MSLRRYMHGLTFVELMATLLIVSIVAAIALPGFNNLLQGNRAVAQADLLLKSFNYARAEAVRRGVEVRVTSISGSQDWGVNGWRVWVDQNGDGAFTAVTDSELQTQSSLAGATLIGPNISEIVFSPNGFLKKVAGQNFTTSFIFNFSVNGRSDLGRNITVMYAGRTSIQ